jgi:hypothetical protein
MVVRTIMMIMIIIIIIEWNRCLLTYYLNSTTSANYKASIRTQNTKRYKYIGKKGTYEIKQKAHITTRTKATR